MNYYVNKFDRNDKETKQFNAFVLGLSDNKCETYLQDQILAKITPNRNYLRCGKNWTNALSADLCRSGHTRVASVSWLASRASCYSVKLQWIENFVSKRMLCAFLGSMVGVFEQRDICVKTAKSSDIYQILYINVNYRIKTF